MYDSDIIGGGGVRGRASHIKKCLCSPSPDFNEFNYSSAVGRGPTAAVLFFCPSNIRIEILVEDCSLTSSCAGYQKSIDVEGLHVEVNGYASPG